jgi:predicted lipid-binding transport protein (Tim44 family)
MKTFSLLVATLALGLAFLAPDSEAAKVLGAGKSSGIQRQAITPNKESSATSPQAPTAVAPAAKSQPPATSPQAQPNRSWTGPLAGLAAGLGLAALASYFGFGEQLASMLMIGLLVMVVMAVIGFVMRRRAATLQPAAARERILQHAGANHSAAMNRGAYQVSMPAASARDSALRGIPVDFDVDAFVRDAKVSFIRLQDANDAINLEDIREFTTPEMFAEIRINITERGNALKETDVVSLNADVIDVAEEPAQYVVSVRFSGLMRESKEPVAEPFDKIWHLVKPRAGKSSWVLAGIQQAHKNHYPVKDWRHELGV